jgi:hypothetical protein
MLNVAQTHTYNIYNYVYKYILTIRFKCLPSEINPNKINKNTARTDFWPPSIFALL